MIYNSVFEMPLLKPGLDWGGSRKAAASVAGPHSTTCHGNSSRIREAPLEGPSRYIWWCVFARSFRCSFSWWRNVGLPLVLG